jgi:hypothetical protein
MKKIFIFSLFVSMCMGVNAQLATSQSNITYRTVIEEPSQPKTYTGWNSLYVEYLPSKLHSQSYTGAALNYGHAFAVTQKLPLFVETGLGGQYSFFKEYGYKTQFVSVKVPLNVIYEYVIPGTSISLDPYAGARLRVNVWGQYESDYGEHDLFDDDEGFGKRVQVGWQAGLKVRFNNAFFVGGSYGTDFMDFSPESKISEATVSLGVTF